MRDNWTITGRSQSHALANAATAEEFWSTLPRNDPFEMQRRLCDELATMAGCEHPDADRFRALRQLDQHVHRLLERLLADYVVVGAQSTARERQVRHATLELSRTFGDEYERFIHMVSQRALRTSWRERASELAVRLFRHREIELVLVLFRGERWPRGRWKSLHDAYQYVLSTGAATRPVPLCRRSDASVIAVTPEQGYIRILLLHLLGDGRFRPEEIAWAVRKIGVWSGVLALQRQPPATDETGSPVGFVVDAAGDEGPARASSTGSGEPLWVDTAPIVLAIDARMTGPRNAPKTAAESVQEQMQRNLLVRLRDLYAPQRTHATRRGERVAVALTSVDATIGNLLTIFRMLHNDARATIEASAASTPCVEEITVTGVGSAQGRLTSGPAGATSRPTHGAQAALYATWQVRDRSESGVRLRGRWTDARLPIRGQLVAFRSDETDPWTVAVVRRAARLVGSNVELGVEHLGRDPKRVILLSSAPSAQATAARRDRIAALYLPKSEARPRMPIGTLIMPTCEFAAGRVMTMCSKVNQVGIRLKEPLEPQADFVWTSFELVTEPTDG